MIYIVCFFTSAVLLGISEWKMDKIIKKILIIIAVSIPIILSGVRYYVGTDYVGYISIFNKIQYLDGAELIKFKDSEIGFAIMCKLLQAFNIDYRGMFFLCSAITVIYIYKSMKKLNTSRFFFLLSYLFMVFPYSMNIVRQGVAISLILYAYTYLFEKQNIKSLVYIIVASTFHITALIVLPLYFIYTFVKEEKKRNVLIFVIYLLLIIICMTNLSVITGIISDRYVSYFDVNGVRTQVFFNTILKKMPTIVLLILFYKRINRTIENWKIFINIFFIGIGMTLIGGLNPVLNRIAMYFTVIDIVIISAIAKAIGNKNGNIIIKICLILYIITYFYYQFCYVRTAEIVPYRTWLFL